MVDICESVDVRESPSKFFFFSFSPPNFKTWLHGKKIILEELPYSSETENMRKNR